MAKAAAWSLALVLSAAIGCGEAAPPPAPAAPPAGVVATIDGEPVTSGELAEALVEENLEQALSNLIVEAVKDLEDGGPASRASATRAHFEKYDGQWPRDVSAAKIEEQLTIRRMLDRYEIRKAWGDSEPAAALVAEIREKAGPKSRDISHSDARRFILDHVEPAQLRRSTEGLVDSRLVDRELQRSGRSVTRTEVAAWSRAMQEKYPPPFDWRMICQFKATTPDQERGRWRRIQAWKRVTGHQPDEKEIRGFFEAYQDHFAGTYRNVGDVRSAPIDKLAEPSFREWVVDEFETTEMKEWIAGLRSRSTIWIAPDSELAKVLDLR